MSTQVQVKGQHKVRYHAVLEMQTVRYGEDGEERCVFLRNIILRLG